MDHQGTKNADSSVGGLRQGRTMDVVGDPHLNWGDLGVTSSVVSALKECCFGVDVIVQAKSGTGKTCVFAVVALERFLKERREEKSNKETKDSSKSKGAFSLVLAPTREVALQIADVFDGLVKSFPECSVAACIGGHDVARDVVKVASADFVVGTPGRIAELIRSGSLETGSIRLVVLDEVDLLLGSFFGNVVEREILSELPATRQTIVSSATFPPPLMARLERLMHDAKAVLVSPASPSLIGVRQLFFPVQTARRSVPLNILRTSALVRLLNSVSYKQAVVFCNSHSHAVLISRALAEEGHPYVLTSGSLRQAEREAALESFVSYQARILVSTDVSARGIDVCRVDFVISWEMPSSPETYLHRVGRAGRFGSYGLSVALVSDEEKLGLLAIRRFYGAAIEELKTEDLSCGIILIGPANAEEGAAPHAVLESQDERLPSDDLEIGAMELLEEKVDVEKLPSPDAYDKFREDFDAHVEDFGNGRDTLGGRSFPTFLPGWTGSGEGFPGQMSSAPMPVLWNMGFSYCMMPVLIPNFVVPMMPCFDRHNERAQCECCLRATRNTLKK